MTPKASRGSRAIPAQSQVRLSAIVTAQNAGAATLELCLTSLLTDQSVDEVVIVDAGAPAPLASALRALSADRRDVRLVTFREEGPRFDLAQALNQGAGAAQGRWLLFVDPDVVVQPGAVDRMLKAGRLARAPAAIGGAVGPRRPVNARRQRASARAVPVDSLPGDLLLIGRHDFDAVQGFEPGGGMAPFLGLSRRLTAAGGELLLQPNAEGVQMGRARGPLQAIAAWWRRLVRR